MAGGFRPLLLNGKKPVTKRFKKEASVILAPGDPVVLTGSAEAVTAVPLITRAQGTEGTPGTITGVVISIDPIRSDLSKKYMAAADTGYVHVCIDPDQLYVIEEDGDSETIVVTEIGEGCDIIVANASTSTGLSNVKLDSSNAGTGDQVQLIEKLEVPNNDLAGSGTKFIVRINEHTFRAAGTMI